MNAALRHAPTAVGMMLVITLPWVLVKLTEFLVSVLRSLPTVVS